MNKEQIKEKLIAQGKLKIAAELDSVHERYKGKTLEKMHSVYTRDLAISPEQFAAYCYLWRNLSPRFSNEQLEYDLG